MKKTNGDRSARLQAMEDEDLDLLDIPERLNWKGAVQGRLYRPLKKQVTLRIDADVLAWFKTRAPKYQTALNAALREHIARQGKRKPSNLC